MSQALQRAWLHRGALARLLWPLAVLYGLLVALRKLLYKVGVLRRDGVPVPVIVVGNVIVGGAGKTPAVMAIVQHLQGCGWRPGVVSRGYGRNDDTCVEVSAASDPSQVGDEPFLIRQTTGVPVFVARNRAEAAQALLAAHRGCNIIVCDDGLQHLALKRDLEVIVFDDRGVGNGWLLPAGPLREPWPRAAELVLHTGAAPAFGGFTSTRRLMDAALRADGTVVPLAGLRGVSVCAVAGIAQPEQFFSMLRGLGLQLVQTVALPDHHDFGLQPLGVPDGLPLLCTQKDAVKLWRSRPDALAVPLHFAPEPAFLAALDAALHQLPSPHGHQTA